MPSIWQSDWIIVGIVLLGAILMLMEIYILAREVKQYRVRAVSAECKAKLLQEELDRLNTRINNHEALS